MGRDVVIDDAYEQQQSQQQQEGQHNNNIDCTYVCGPASGTHIHAGYRTSLTSVAGCLLVHPRSARLPSRCALAARQPAGQRPVDARVQLRGTFIRLQVAPMPSRDPEPDG